ncbi:CYTH and CHAD domain-containing protein [Kitasatospora paranensis]|uniref:CYTH and CHAD domain-containing protein n=1 Tax=Kitasatospora paranensis TaxID=258053 RepID=A0ABW2FRX0_9ACTN
MATVHEENERTYDGALQGRLSAASLPQVAAVRSGGTETLDAVYFDTEDLRLLRRGITLRRRAGGHDAGWHLKTPGGNGTRTEIRLPLDGGDSPPPELVARTRTDARGSALAAVAHLRTRRDLTLLVGADGRTLAEVARDTVSAELPGSSGPPARGAGRSAGDTQWVETEVELAEGDPELLDTVEAALAEHGLHLSSSPSKLGRVLRGRLPEGPDGNRAAAPARPLHPTRSLGDAVTAYLRDQVAGLRALDPAVRLDEPDSVHRMRVHVRRLRSALAAHRRILRKHATDRLDQELRWWGKVLGRARDAEVLGASLTAGADDLPADAHPARTGQLLASHFARRYDEAHAAAVEAMDSPRYFALLDALERLADDPPLRRRARKGRAQARRMLRRQRRRTTERLGSALGLPPGPKRDRALHRARKAAKRARYAAESVLPLTERRAAQLRKRMKKVQQPLGSHQDGVMREQALRALASRPSTAAPEAFGLGVLHAAQRRHQRRDLEAAARAYKRLRS